LSGQQRQWTWLSGFQTVKISPGCSTGSDLLSN